MTTAATGPETRAHAPGKLILAGDHAAVAGHPVIAVALGLRCTATVRTRTDRHVELNLPDVSVRRITSWHRIARYATAAHSRWHTYAQDPDQAAFASVRGHDPAHVVVVALGETLGHLSGDPGGATVTVSSRIPVGGGLGSSAAAAAAVSGALLGHAQGALDPHLVETIVQRAERYQHGVPSGIDTATVVRGGTVALTHDGAGTPHLRRIPAGEAVLRAFELYSTGLAAEPTGEVVRAVRDRLTAAALEEARQATTRLGDALTVSPPDHAATITAIRQAEAFMEGLGVVPEGVRAAVRAVEALGGAAKVCGAGSLRGPGAGALLILRPASGNGTGIPQMERFLPLNVPLGADGLCWEAR